MNEASPNLVIDKRAIRTVGIVGAAIIGGLVVMVSLFFAWFALPRFTEVFTDFDIELPALTVHMILYGHITIPFAAMLWAAVLVLCAALPLRPAVRGILAFLLMLVLAVFVLLLALAVFLPMVALMQSF